MAVPTVWSWLPVMLPVAIGIATSPVRAQEDLSFGATLGAQQMPSPAASDPYVPIRGDERIGWVIDDAVGPLSLGVGGFTAAWQTALDIPKRWGRTPSGFWTRFGNREIDVGLSSSIEAGLGALWGEEPRYIRSHRSGKWRRLLDATNTVVVTQRPDGHLAPAWGRYAGNVVNNVIENTWMPSSTTTWHRTMIRSGGGLVSRWGGNVWREFWPDVRARIVKRVK